MTSINIMAVSYTHLDLFEKSEVNEFDFILMDIMMPKLNGLDAVSYTHLDVYKRQAYGVFID